MSEYQGGTVNYSGCSYNTLCNLDQGARAPVRGVPSMSCQIIPNWSGRPAYDALTHGLSPAQANCGGHFSLQSAYPWPCKTQYHLRPCAFGCNQPDCGQGGGGSGGATGPPGSRGR